MATNASQITPEVVEQHGLSPEEYERVLNALGREPNLLELGIFSVMWSEHCSYKSSRLHLKKLPTEAEWVICGPGENAGVIDIGLGADLSLRQSLGSFTPGDVAVMDRYYCSFMMIALLLARNVEVCARMHQKRHVDFRRGRRLGKYDHIIVWTRPQRPKWMDQATYEAIPERMELREIRYHIVQPGYRTKTITIVTTLTDAELYFQEKIAELYGFRWNSELDIRSIKQSLNLAHVRPKSPEMVRKEL